jgi:hypothetical protein
MTQVGSRNHLKANEVRHSFTCCNSSVRKGLRRSRTPLRNSLMRSLADSLSFLGEIPVARGSRGRDLNHINSCMYSHATKEVSVTRLVLRLGCLVAVVVVTVIGVPLPASINTSEYFDL